MLGKFINHCEDSLTAAVFTHLLHLPSEVFWQLLRTASYSTTLPEVAGEPLSVEFWPPWDSEGTDNSNRVIPDLFIRFKTFDLIIEAKRRDYDMQSPEQWSKELIAYLNEYPEKMIPVRMMAIGGIRNTQDDAVSCGDVTCPVHMCRWTRLLDECKRMRKELERLKYPASQTQAHVRTLAHVIELFACHGFQTGEWFSDLDLTSQLLRLRPSANSHHKTFQDISMELNK